MKPLKLLFLIFLFLSVAGTFYQVFFNVPQLEQIDLRNRIVASRLTETGHSPYHYKWKPGDSQRLLNRREFTTGFSEMPVTYTTVSPSVLLIHQPLSKFNYLVIKNIWLWLQLAFLLFMILWFAYTSERGNEALKIWVLFTGCLFSIGFAWHLHLSVGQFYIIYPFIMTLAFASAICDKKVLKFAGGFLAGMAILFRPSFAIFFLPFIFNRQYLMLVGALSGVATGILIFVLPYIILWEQYLDAMKFWATYNILGGGNLSGLSTPQWLPDTVEGFSPSEGSPFRGRIENTSIQYLFFKFANIELTSIYLTGMLFLVISSVFIFLRKRLFRLSITGIFLLGACLVIVSDFFLPAPRMPYNAVQWIFPLLLVSMYFKRNFNYINILIVSGLVLNLSSVWWLQYNMWLGEILIFSGILLFIKEDDSELVKSITA
ncbi:MAG: hypothetical protein WD077_02255 [Bacteroidia bacterium]